jgi:hypothetical protein
MIADDQFKGYLDDHQLVALRKLRNGKVLWGGVGTGKSRVAAAYYTVHEAPKDVYVITTARKRDSFDWPQEFYQLGIGPATGPSVDIRRDRVAVQQREDNSELREVAVDAGRGNSVVRSGINSGRVERGDVRISPGDAGDRHGYPYVLTVDSWNNIGRYRDVKGAFFIFDEQRLVGSGEWTKNFLRISANNSWLLLSGTPGDTWMDYVPLFIANGFYKNRTEFKREHVVYNTFTKFPKVDRYINQGRLARQRSQLLVEMPFERHTKRRHVEVPLQYDRDLLNRVLKERWNVYEDRPLRDVAEMFLVGRKVVNSDPSRLEMVKQLWQTHPRLIVFYNFNYELAALRSLTVPPGTDSITNWESSSKTSPQPLSVLMTKEYPGSRSSSRTTSHVAKRSLPTPATCGKEGAEWKTNTLLLPNGAGPQTEMTKPISRAGFMDTSVNNASFGKMNSGKRCSSEKVPANLEVFSTMAAGSPVLSERPSSSTASVPHLAEWNGHRHQPVPSAERWIYLVQYTAGAEAWNCITTDAMIMFSQNYSWKIMEQAYGRTDRINTPFRDLWYYGFITDSFIDRAIKRSLDAKETFNAVRYKGIFES